MISFKCSVNLALYVAIVFILMKSSEAQADLWPIHSNQTECKDGDYLGSGKNRSECQQQCLEDSTCTGIVFGWRNGICNKCYNDNNVYSSDNYYKRDWDFYKRPGTNATNENLNQRLQVIERYIRTLNYIEKYIKEELCHDGLLTGDEHMVDCGGSCPNTCIVVEKAGSYEKVCEHCMCGGRKNKKKAISLNDCKERCSNDSNCLGIEYWSGLETTSNQSPVTVCFDCTSPRSTRSFNNARDAAFPPTVYERQVPGLE